MSDWKLDKHISVGHIMTTVMVAGSVFVWAMSVEKRLTIGEIERAASITRSEEIQQNTKRRFDELISWLRRINDRLERMADK